MADTVVGASADPHVTGDDPNRRDFIHIAAGVAAAGLVGGLAWPFIDQMNPAGDTLALASIEFDMSKVEEGGHVTIKWRGKPLFIRHRTAARPARCPHGISGKRGLVPAVEEPSRRRGRRPRRHGVTFSARRTGERHR